MDEKGIEANIDDGGQVPVTFGGAASATVKKGEVLISDEIAFEVKPQSVRFAFIRTTT